MKGFKQIAKVVHVSQGDKIIDEHQETTTVFMIVSGEAKSTIEVKGKVIDGPIIEMGRLFGGLGLVKDNDKKLVVEALEATTLLCVTLKSISVLQKTKPSDGREVLKDILNRVGLFNQLLNNFIEAKTINVDRFLLQGSEYKTVRAVDEEASYTIAKKYVCPICHEHVEAKAVRETKIKSVGRGDFFMNYYEPIDPLWYGLVTCDSCGFTERHEAFANPIKFNVDKIHKALSEVYHPGLITYSQPRNLEEVLNGYEMLEKTMEIRGLALRVRARGYLVMYELLNRCGFLDASNVYRDRAFDFYKGMFNSGILDVDDLQLQQLYLILGKLHEKRSEHEAAKASYRKAKMLKGVEDPKFIELAENFLIALESIE